MQWKTYFIFNYRYWKEFHKTVICMKNLIFISNSHELLFPDFFFGFHRASQSTGKNFAIQKRNVQNSNEINLKMKRFHFQYANKYIHSLCVSVGKWSAIYSVNGKYPTITIAAFFIVRAYYMCCHRKWKLLLAFDWFKSIWQTVWTIKLDFFFVRFK